MKELQRLTTEYVEAEDRIRISGELTSSETVVMWLSQRLLLRLLPHLFLWLEKQSNDNIPMEIEQSFAQEAAKANLTPEAPVQRLTGSQEWLVGAVDLTPNSNTLAMSFRSQTGQRETLALQAVPLRQWLEIIHTLWAVAEWPSHVWPEWIASKGDASELDHASRLH
tara:strand:+ start:383 stop:883 length:501 start_codon:yes stop_codon:yes gene_type:complete